jgi:hypothetical protein
VIDLENYIRFARQLAVLFYVTLTALPLLPFVKAIDLDIGLSIPVVPIELSDRLLAFCGND